MNIDEATREALGGLCLLFEARDVPQPVIENCNNSRIL